MNAVIMSMILVTTKHSHGVAIAAKCAGCHIDQKFGCSESQVLNQAWRGTGPTVFKHTAQRVNLGGRISILDEISRLLLSDRWNDAAQDVSISTVRLESAIRAAEAEWPACIGEVLLT